MNRWTILATGLSLTMAMPAPAGEGPHVLASIWLEESGETRTPDGLVYRLTDAKGHLRVSKEPLVLTILRKE